MGGIKRKLKSQGRVKKMIKIIEFALVSKKRIEMIDITAQVVKYIAEYKLKNGFVKVFIPHTTVGLTINENSDPYVQRDMMNALSELIPESSNFYHVEGNSDAHLKSSLFGVDLDVLVENGKIKLGTWQSIYFCEFDCPRSRKVFIQLFGEGT